MFAFSFRFAPEKSEEKHCKIFCSVPQTWTQITIDQRENCNLEFNTSECVCIHVCVCVRAYVCAFVCVCVHMFCKQCEIDEKVKV